MYYQFGYSLRMEWTKLIVVILSFACLECQHNPHFWPNRSAIVHLFEWKWNDIGDECERFLAPRGYAGVQTSPANENIIINNRPWWERYQPISYKLITRSGNEEEFANMVRRCNKVGVRIYVDAVINHMAAPSVNSIGTGGSVAGPESTHFPAVPYSYLDFNLPCGIENRNDPIQVRNCDLVGLKDLNHRVPWVRDRVIEFLNKLIGLGVAGFRIDAAKHMWPEDLKIIFDNLRDLNMSHGFPEKSRPFIYQEIIGFGGDAISKYEYTPLGVVTEFKFSKELGRAFRGHNDLKWLSGFGPLWGLLPSQQALAFIDNHDNQRGHGSKSADILTHKDSRRYKMATAFALAYPYGFTRIMSSYAFDNNDHGPPSDSQQNILSPIINPDNTCGNGWICEHRWRQIYNMIDFKNLVRGTNVTNWWSNDKNRISFCRGEIGFIAFNGEESDMDEDLQTCLPEGIYCDIISGEMKGKKCSGKYVVVYKGGRGKVIIRSSDEDGVVAIHLESKIW